MERVVEELKHGSPVALRHPPEVHDRSVPQVPKGYHVEPFDNSELLHSVEKGVPLRHVPEDQLHDRSEPVIDSSIHVSTTNKDEFLTEVQAKGAHSAAVHELRAKFLEEAREGGLPLHHVEAIHDTSAPKLSPDVHLHKSPMPDLLAEVKEPYKFLNHVEHVNDRSGPMIDGTVKVHIGHGSPRAELLESIKAVASSGSPLHHVRPEERADKSSPVVAKTAAMRVMHPAGYC